MPDRRAVPFRCRGGNDPEYRLRLKIENWFPFFVRLPYDGFRSPPQLEAGIWIVRISSMFAAVHAASSAFVLH